MAFTNEQVAERFVAGKEGKGSNTQSRAYRSIGVHNSWVLAGMEFVSYSTVVATIFDNRLYICTHRYSPTTDRQLSYVRRAGAIEKLGAPIYVPFVHEGGSRRNVEHYLHTAKQSLQEICAPHIRMTTRQAHWGDYLRNMEYADRLMTLPNYGTPISPEFMAEKYDPANRARAGLNPVGLEKFDNDMLLRVKAITALEGEGT